MIVLLGLHSDENDCKGFHPWSPDAALGGRPPAQHWSGVGQSRALQWSVHTPSPVHTATAAIKLTCEAKFHRTERKGLLAFYLICSIKPTLNTRVTFLYITERFLFDCLLIWTEKSFPYK